MAAQAQAENGWSWVWRVMGTSIHLDLQDPEQTNPINTLSPSLTQW